MTDKIVYATSVDVKPDENIPIAHQPRVVVGEYVDDIYVPPLNSHLMEDERINTRKIDKCWKYSSWIRIVSGVDVMFSIINGIFYNPWLLCTALIPLCGYQGAIQFCSCKTTIYLIYLYVSWFSRVVEICEISKIINTDNSTYIYETIGVNYDPRVPLTIVSMSCLLQFIIAISASMFICMLYRLNTHELVILRDKSKAHNLRDFICC